MEREPSCDDILAELDTDYFIQEYLTKIEATLNSMEEGKSIDEQIDSAGDCLQEFWANYSRKHLAGVLRGFPKIEKALYGLELEEETGARYRDHFLHMFNVFILGSRILSLFLSGLEEDKIDNSIREFFKVEPEPKEVPFDKKYNAKNRLFFLWTLIATFHDVGIPIEHLEKIRDGLNNFLNHFGLRIREFTLERQSSLDAQINYYINLMSRMFDCRIKMTNSIYEMNSARPHPYIYKALADAYSEDDHGVVSALCLFRSIEETFLTGYHEEEKNDLNLEQCKQYVSYVLEQDIARTALAIALHSCKLEEHPKIFPISFDEFPLTFLLILCDELQEYFRPEGISLEPITKLKKMPSVKVHVDEGIFAIEIEIYYSQLSISEKHQKQILNQAQIYAQQKGEPEPKTIEKLLKWYWSEVMERLEQKLEFRGKDATVKLEVVVSEITDEGLLKNIHIGRAP